MAALDAVLTQLLTIASMRVVHTMVEPGAVITRACATDTGGLVSLFGREPPGPPVVAVGPTVPAMFTHTRPIFDTPEPL